MNTILLSVAIFVSVSSLIVGGLALYILWRRSSAFKELHDYMIRMEKYAEGIADIHGGLKETIMDHHSTMEAIVHETKKEIIDQIGYTLRWSEVISKLIRVGDQSPEYSINGATDPLKKAEQMHEIGVEIVEIAFDEKTALEKKEAAAVREELAEAKETISDLEPNGQPKST